LRLTFDKTNPLGMTESDRWPKAGSRGFSSRVARRALGFLFALALVPALAQNPADKVSPVNPLPQDTGAAGLNEMLLRLPTTARLLHITAHPDDEDGGMLTLESRGRGVTAELLTLNRGEGGQNKVGSNLFDVLGVLRTLELTASDRYYRVEQRFTRVADFGFSKTADETFQKWQGHDIALADMVRVIRTFRPDVIVSRFGGTDRDGHGNHQASGILSGEAFRAAADPNRFPEQIAEGLPPWQAKKLYIDNVCPFRSNECPAKDYTVKLSTGEMNPALGMTYVQFAMQGLKRQLSQGAGGWSVDAGPHYAFYRLLDSALPSTTDGDGHEKDFFDGIDTTLPGLATRLGDEGKKVPFLKPALVNLDNVAAHARAAAAHDLNLAVNALLTGFQSTNALIAQIETSSLSAGGRNALLAELITKQAQFEAAANLAAGIQLEVDADVPIASDAEDAFMAVPGQTFGATVRVTAGAGAVVKRIELDVPPGWTAKQVGAPETGLARFQVTVSPEAQYTKPYWHRAEPEIDAINTVDDTNYATLPFPPAPVEAHVIYALNEREGIARRVLMVRYKEPDGTESKRPLAVAPPFSIALEPGNAAISTSHPGNTEITVGLRSNIATSGEAQLRLELPKAWSAEPSGQKVGFDHPGESKNFNFQIRPADLREGHYQVKARLDYRGKSYDLGYSVVTRSDLDTFYYYQPAIQRLSIVDVKVLKNLKVAYIMGAGDDIPTILKQVGVDVSLVPAEKLRTEDLSRYGTIVLGIRAYDTEKDVATNNKKLLDYVSDGGTLIVQYNASVSDFNSGHFTPYPAQLSRARVSVEEAPVDILAPDDSVFHYPNQITPKDFEGWVQERGLYFMDQWDEHFKALLACHDPGEGPQKGGLLRARYGKGTYIYAGYAFFRQLPVGVPGAIRLYVNLLSAGHGT